MSNVFSESPMVQPKCKWESVSQIAGGIIFLVPPNVRDHRAGGMDGFEAESALVAGSGASPCWADCFYPRTAASISFISIFICFIIAAVAFPDIFLSEFRVNSVSLFGKICHETP
jgi:hypothetical protein